DAGVENARHGVLADREGRSKRTNLVRTLTLRRIRPDDADLQALERSEVRFETQHRIRGLEQYAEPTRAAVDPLVRPSAGAGQAQRTRNRHLCVGVDGSSAQQIGRCEL